MNPLFVALLASCLLPPGFAAGQTSGSSTRAGAVGQKAKVGVNLVQVVSGTSGSQQSGRYYVDDPRNTFHIPEDKQVVVYFEWDGSPGTHKFEGVWKGPDGKLAAANEFSYDATSRRFGAYWTLVLVEGTTPGRWTVEARVDGEPAGTHSFEIVVTPKPADAAPVRRMMPPSEIYKRALASTVLLEKLDAAGQVIGAGSAFAIAPDVLVTTFQVLDGATSMRAVLPDGKREAVTKIFAYHRWQDWALVGGTFAMQPLPTAPAGSAAVGHRAFTLESPTEGSRVIIDTNITGRSSFPEAGDRWNVAHHPSPSSVGTPLLNEYAEVVGVMGTRLIPTSASIETRGLVMGGYPYNIVGAGSLFVSTWATPIESVPVPVDTERAVTLEQIAQKGEFAQPIRGRELVERGTMARSVDKRSGFPIPQDEKFEFSRSEKTAVVYVLWSWREKGRRQGSLRIFDLNNRLLVQSKPTRLNMRPGDRAFTTFQIDLTPLPTAIYRVDVLLDDDPAWRSYFRLAE